MSEGNDNRTTWITRDTQASDVAWPLKDESDAVELLRKRVSGWLFAPLHGVAQDPHAGFTLLSVLVPYFDLIGQYILGADSHGAEVAIHKGLQSVYPGRFAENERGRFIEIVRHGVAHCGFPREEALLCGEFTQGLEIQPGAILINPHRLLSELEEHFNQFIRDAKLGSGRAATILRVENSRRGAAKLRIKRDATLSDRLSLHKKSPLDTATGEALASGIDVTGDFPPLGPPDEPD